MRRRFLPALTTLSLLLSLGLAGPAAQAAQAAQAGQADPGFDQPTVGSCHDYSHSAEKSLSESSPPVSCTLPHTALTVAVVTPPAKVNLATGRGVLKKVGTACYRAEDQALGGHEVPIAYSTYTFIFWLPTADELAQGARWVRCDLILPSGPALLPLPTPLLPRHHRFPTSMTSCLKGGPSFAGTACSRPHDYRITGVLRLHGRYRTARAFDRVGASQCRAHVHGRTFRWTWPVLQAWRAGFRIMVCYSKTTH